MILSIWLPLAVSATETPFLFMRFIKSVYNQDNHTFLHACS